MSGGAFDYAYSKVNEFADQLELRLEQATTSPGDWLSDIPASVRDVLLDTVNEARIAAAKMKAVEWYFSGDTGDETLLKDVMQADLKRMESKND